MNMWLVYDSKIGGKLVVYNYTVNRGLIQKYHINPNLKNVK